MVLFPFSALLIRADEKKQHGIDKDQTNQLFTIKLNNYCCVVVKVLLYESKETIILITLFKVKNFPGNALESNP